MKNTKLALIISTIFMANTAFAADVLPEIQQVQPVAPKNEAAPVKLNPDMLVDDAKPAQKPLEDIKIPVKAFKITGNTEFSNETLMAKIALYQGKELGLRELNEVTDIVRDFYRREGFLLAKAYLPPQDLEANGYLEIAVIEGKIGDIEVKSSDSDMNTDFIKRLASYNLKNGDVVKESNLVRNLMVINNLPGARVTSQLIPGDEVGEANIVVDVEPKEKYRGFVQASNYGNRFTGRENVGFGLAFNNLAGRGDQLSLSGKTSQDQTSFGTYYAVPVGDAGDIVNLSYNYVDYAIGKEFKKLDANGSAHYMNATLDHNLFRDTHQNLNLKFGGGYKILNDDIDAFDLQNRRSIESLEIGLNGDWINAKGNTVYQYGALLTHGSVNFRDKQAEAYDKLGLDTAGGFTKLNITGNRTQFFENGVTWAVHGDYQMASKNLDVAERIGMGSINRWRQFSNLPSQADEGWIVGTDVRTRLATKNDTINKYVPYVSPYAFFDTGRGHISRDPLGSNNNVSTTQYGAGLDFTVAKDYVVSATYSHQKRDLEGLGSQAEDMVWWSVRKNF